jgi:hypothetical protein
MTLAPTPSRRPDPRLSNLVLEGGRSKSYPPHAGGQTVIYPIAKARGLSMASHTGDV